MFKVIIASLVLALPVWSHMGVVPALGVTGTFARSNVQRPSAANVCGTINIANTIDTSTVVAAKNGVATFTAENFNGGADGSTFVTAKVDPTGTGKKFVAATVTKNGNKAPTSGTEKDTITVQLPAGTTCTGGKAKNLCLMQFISTANFGNCAVVSNAAPKKGRKDRNHARDFAVEARDIEAREPEFEFEDFE